MAYQLKYSHYGERSILIEWPQIIDENVLVDILKFKKAIHDKYIKQNIEIINAYNSILIIYNCTIDVVNDEILTLKSLYKGLKFEENIVSKLWNIPVCYDDEFAIDLESFSEEKKLSKSEIIKLHSEAIYTVYFIGFLPGFLYLGGLNSSLHLDRKSAPNLNIKKGAVGIGGQQTGIYPKDSPGGWHIIGNSPIDLFDPQQNPPCFISAGDKVKFTPISKSDYFEIRKRISNSNFNLKQLEAYG